MAETFTRRLQIIIDESGSEQTLKRLQANAEKLQQSIDRGTKSGKDMSAELNKLEQTRSKISALEGVISGKMEPSLRQARAAASNLRRELESMSKDAPGYAAKFEKFKEVSAQLKTMETRMGSFRQVATSTFSQIKQIALGVTVGNTITAATTAITGYFSGIISGAAKVSDSLADIEKASDLTRAQIMKLNSELSRLNTRTATSDLRELAVALGQAGEAVNIDNIAALDKINVALGDEFGDNTREIGNAISVLRNNLQDMRTENYADDVSKIGNALNVMGANGLATAPVVTDIANRIAGVGQTFGVTSGQILGVAASFQELGINTERGSTAYVKILQKMASDTEAFASVVAEKMSGADFRKLVNENINEALLLVATSIKEAGSTNTQFAKILDELNAEGAGVSEMFSKLAANADLVRGKIDLAGQALTNTNSITDEFNKKNNTLAAQIEKLNKEFNRMLGSTGIQNGVKALLDAALWAVQSIKDLTEWVKNNMLTLGLWTAAIIVNTGAWRGMLTAMLTTGKGIASITILQKAATVANALWNASLALVTGNITRLNVQLARLRVIIAANPLGALLVALGAAVLLFKRLSESVQEVDTRVRAYADINKRASESTLETSNQIQILTNVLKSATASYDTKKKALQELIAINPQYLQGLTLENATMEEGTRIIQDYMKHLRAKADFEAASSYRTDKMKEDLKLMEQQMELEKKIAQGRTGLGDLTKEEKEFVGESRKNFAFTASVVDKIVGTSAAEEAVNYIKWERAKIAQQLDVTDKVVADKYQKIGNTVNEGPQVDVNTEKPKKEVRKKIDQAKKDLENLLNELAGIEQDIALNNMDPYIKQLNLIGIKFSELMARAGNDIELRKRILTAMLQETQQLNREFQKEIDKAAITPPEEKQEEVVYVQMGDMALRNRERLAKLELDVINATGEEKLKAQKRLLNEQMEQEIAAVHRNRDVWTTSAEDVQNQVNLIKAKFRQKDKEAEEAHAMEMADVWISALKYFSDLASEVNSIMSNLESMRINRIEANYSREREGLDNMLRNKLITQKNYDLQVQQMEDKMQKEKAKIAKREHKRQQVMNITSILMDSLAAGIGLWKKPGFPANIPLLVMLAAQTAAGITGVLAQQPPQYAKGGILPQGPSHAQGGISLVAGGRKVGEIEGGEPIISRRTYAANKPIVDALLKKGWSRDHTPLNVNWMNTMPKHINIPRIASSYSVPRFESGGFAPQPTGDPTAGGINNELLMALLNRLNEPIQANVIYGQYENKANTLRAIREQGRLS